MTGRVIPLIAAVVLAGATSTPADEPPRPNFVLCMADDQGWGDMAYNGHPHVLTPTFDEMARSGLRFDRFYAAASVCSPTRASVLTGRTPNRAGVFSWGHSMRPDEITLAERLRGAGYRTAHFGKWHLGSVLDDYPTSPGAQGFDDWLSAPNFFELDPWLARRGHPEQFAGEGSAIIVEQALAYMRERVAAEEPFLVVVWFASPHVPHVGTAGDRALYADHPEPVQHFLAEITAMDRAMGQLREGLRQLKIAENTVLWYCSDNGAIPAGSTGGRRGQKGTLYEGGICVPGLIEWPARIRSPRVVELPVSTVDIYPTVLELAGVPIPDEPPLDGQSLVELFDGPVASRKRPLGFWQTPISGQLVHSDRILAESAERLAAGQQVEDPAAQGYPQFESWVPPAGSYPGHAAWIDGAWKLHRLEDENGEVHFELYDLASDPTESHDRRSDEPQRLETMRTELEVWLESITAEARARGLSSER